MRCDGMKTQPSQTGGVHADFLRVDKNQPIVVNVPLHFTNEEACIGVKVQGGRIL